MKRLTAFILTLLLLCQCLPAVTAAEAVPAAEPLTQGLYLGENGDYLYLVDTESVSSGYLAQKTDEGAYYHGVVWFSDTLIIEMTLVPFTYEGGVLKFSFFGRDHELVFDPEYPVALGYEGVPGTLDLSGATVRSADGTTVSFSADGTGILTQPGKDPVSLVWGGIAETATEGLTFAVTLSFLSGVTYENTILSFRIDDETEIKASPVSRTDITGTEVVCPEYHFRVILSDPSWTSGKEDEVYAFRSASGLAWMSLYDFDIGTDVITAEDVDGGLDALISQLGAELVGEYYDCSVAGLFGRGCNFKFNNGMDFEGTEWIFINGHYAYYLTLIEAGSLSEETIQVFSDLIDTFTLAE